MIQQQNNDKKKNDEINWGWIWSERVLATKKSIYQITNWLHLFMKAVIEPGLAKWIQRVNGMTKIDWGWIWSGGALTTKKKIPNWQPALFCPWKPSTETHYAQLRYKQTAAHAIPISMQQELWAFLYQHEPPIRWFRTFPPIALSKLANCIHSKMFPKLLAGETMTTQQFDLPL